MAGAFEIATRAAIEELIQMHAQPSKFGYILTKDGAQKLADGVFDLLMTSRTLKTAGEKFLAGSTQQTPPRPTPTLRPAPKNVARKLD